MPTTTDVDFIEMRIAKVVGFGPPLAQEYFSCVVLDELSGDSHLVIQIGEMEAFSLAGTLQGLEFGRPMTYQFTVALMQGLGGRVRQVRLDRLIDGAYAATVEVEGPSAIQSVDARASDALNLAAMTSAPVFVSPEVAADGARRQAEGSAEARLLRVAVTTPNMTITRGEAVAPLGWWAERKGLPPAAALARSPHFRAPTGGTLRSVGDVCARSVSL